MRNYSLISLLISGVFQIFISFLLLFVVCFSQFKSYATNFISNLCLEGDCSPRILSLSRDPEIFSSAIADILIFAFPWFALILAVTSGLTYFLYKGISLPLQEIQHRATKFSRGVFNSDIGDYKIKEIVRFAKTMNNLATKLKGLELMRKDFVANVSHELKTPITSIKGYVETVLDGDFENPEETREFLCIIKGQADRMNSIIEDLILISKLENESSALALQKEISKVDDLLSTVESQLSFVAKEKKISLVIVCPKDLTITCNPTLIGQAISNVIDNSIKYCSQGAKIEVHVLDHIDGIDIVIKDNGPGISSAELPRIFERFYRVDKARSRLTGGSGLGLSISKHIISAHDGKISVQSERGIGTEFKVELPKSA